MYLIQIWSCSIITIWLCSCHCQLTDFTSPLFLLFLLLFFFHKYVYGGFLLWCVWVFFLVEVNNLKKKMWILFFSSATTQTHEVNYNTSEHPLTQKEEKAWWIFSRHTLLQCHSKPGFICFPPHCQNMIPWCSPLLHRPRCPFQSLVFHDSSGTNFTETP